MRSHQCPKCNGAMVEGFVPTEKSSMPLISVWVEGPPQKGWMGNVKQPGTPIPIETWRCRRCGYLESYARG